MVTASNTFGCNTCWTPDANDAWVAAKLLRLKFELADESHFMVKLRSCPNCQQHFLSAFAEVIGWADSEDPQFCCVLPITSVESKKLMEAGSNLVPQLYCLAPDRRSLCHDFPKSGGPKNYWSSGVMIGPHD